mgnify:CR=1 FL=1
MQNFNEWQEAVNNPVVEKKVFEKDPSKLHCIVLGLGEEEGTFADIVSKITKKRGMKSVSYTHLTLPTKRIV